MKRIKAGAKVFVKYRIDEQRRCPICGLGVNKRMDRFNNQVLTINNVYSVGYKSLRYNLVEDEEKWSFCNHWVRPIDNSDYIE